MKQKIAIIDIGSNTLRLVIYENAKSGKRFKEIENMKKATRIRNFLNDEQELNEEGIHFLLNTLRDFQTIINLYEVKETICVATATIRQAKNKHEILKIVLERTGLALNILGEYEEAYYGYLAVINSIDLVEGITIDMGGGSTEITHFNNRELIHHVSLPFGALSLKIQFVKGDIPTEQELVQIRQYIRSQLQKISWIENIQIPIIAMGGSARNVAQLHQNFIHYPLAGIHHYEMSISNIHDIKESLKSLTFKGLQNAEGLSRDRADTILLAIEVFEILSDYSSASRFILSEKGLREGVLYSKWNQREREFTTLVDSEIHELIEEYHIDVPKSKQLVKIALMFFNSLKEVHGIGIEFSTSDLELLKRGARVYHLGNYLNEESGPLTFSLLANRPIGFSHKERVKLALIASYKGRGTFRQFLDPFKGWLTKDERKKLCLLGAILKLSQSLNKSERNIVNEIKIQPNDDSWFIDLYCLNDYGPEKYQFEKQKKHLEKLLKITLIPHFHLVNR
ncbi:Ppx/GppA family phosphatase [Neobacillus drentensis]|uniref:Ppx/GppA family phosphatase n=1 Tax=Neobacillus drentensis TaxID=220684 RepID=UPI002FFFB4FC